MQKYKFSIIIPHINEGYLLDIMLDSIYNQFHYDNYEIIIVDDGSDDISHLDFIKTHFLKDKITLYFEKNLGLSKVKNFGAAKASGDYLIFFDSHMYFRDDFLSKLGGILFKCQEIDLLQPIVGNIKQKSSQGQIYKIKDFLLNSTWDKVVDKGIQDIYETPNISGGATIVKKEVFEKLEGFHHYFIKWGCEDVEFSMRAWLSGYKCFFTHQLFVAHYFKDSFTNTTITSENVVHNRIMFALTCFFGERQVKILEKIEQEYGDEFYNKIYDQVTSNNEFFIWRNKVRGDFLYDDDWYFKKFKSYYHEFIKNKIAIITQYTENIKNYSQYTLEINEQYAKKHGYDFIVQEGRYITDNSKSIAWDRVKLTQDNLDKYEYIVWLDADIMIMNYEKKIEEFISDKNLIICSDNSNSGRDNTVNGGAYILKNSDYSKQLLEKWLDMGVELGFTFQFPAEQETLVYMYQNNIMSLQENITVYPENTFNSSNPAHLLYKPGQFLIHMMATDNIVREEYFKKYYSDIIEKYNYKIKK